MPRLVLDDPIQAKVNKAPRLVLDIEPTVKSPRLVLDTKPGSAVEAFGLKTAEAITSIPRKLAEVAQGDWEIGIPNTLSIKHTAGPKLVEDKAFKAEEARRAATVKAHPVASMGGSMVGGLGPVIAATSLGLPPTVAFGALGGGEKALDLAGEEGKGLTPGQKFTKIAIATAQGVVTAKILKAADLKPVFEAGKVVLRPTVSILGRAVRAGSGSAATAFTSSLAQDVAGGEQLDIAKAAKDALVSGVIIGAFKAVSELPELRGTIYQEANKHVGKPRLNPEAKPGEVYQKPKNLKEAKTIVSEVLQTNPENLSPEYISAQNKVKTQNAIKNVSKHATEIGVEENILLDSLKTKSVRVRENIIDEAIRSKIKIATAGKKVFDWQWGLEIDYSAMTPKAKGQIESLIQFRKQISNGADPADILIMNELADKMMAKSKVEMVVGGERVKAASTLGSKAFAEGKQATPIQDPELVKLLEGLPVGEGAPIMEAWTKAWNKANLSAPVPEVADEQESPVSSLSTQPESIIPGKTGIIPVQPTGEGKVEPYLVAKEGELTEIPTQKKDTFGKIWQPGIAANPSNKLKAEIRKQTDEGSFLIDEKLFDTEAQANVWIANHSGEVSGKIASKYVKWEDKLTELAKDSAIDVTPTGEGKVDNLKQAKEYYLGSTQDNFEFSKFKELGGFATNGEAQQAIDEIRKTPIKEELPGYTVTKFDVIPTRQGIEAPITSVKHYDSKGNEVIPKTAGGNIVEDLKKYITENINPDINTQIYVNNLIKRAEDSTPEHFASYIDIKKNKKLGKFLSDNGMDVGMFQEVLKSARAYNPLTNEETQGILTTGGEKNGPTEQSETDTDKPGTSGEGSSRTIGQTGTGELPGDTSTPKGRSDQIAGEHVEGERQPVRIGVHKQRSPNVGSRYDAPSKQAGTVSVEDQPVDPATAYKTPLEETEVKSSSLTVEQANQYAQKGSQKGATGADILSAYFTPQVLADTMQDLLKAEGLSILEPSAGSGNLISTLSEKNNITAVEMNTKSAHVIKDKNPKAKVLNTWAEKFFHDNTQTFDIVIMNPPYNMYKSLFRSVYKDKETTYTNYFMRESAKVLNKDGYLVALIPHTFMRQELTNAKQIMAEQGMELINAYRVPSEIFEGDSAIAIDLLVMKKTGNANTGEWDNNAYFTEHPEKVLGEITTIKGNYGRELEAISGDLTVAINHIRKDYGLPEIAEVIPQKTTKKKAVAKAEEVATVEEPKSETAKAEEMKGLVALYDNLDHKGALKDTSDAMLELFKNDLNYSNGDYYPDFFYLFGNIRERLAALENDLSSKKIDKARYTLQKNKLLQVLPEYKFAKDIFLDPRSSYFDEVTKERDRDGKVREVRTKLFIGRFMKYLRDTEPSEKGVKYHQMIGYVRGDNIRRDEHQNPEAFREKRRHVTIKYFNEFLQEEEHRVKKEGGDNIIDKINYDYYSNNIPNFANYPFVVDNLSPIFKKKELVLGSHQIEGAAFLVSRGLGYLAYEVGSGKTMTSILAVEKMIQSGRCKRPAIFAPKGITKNFFFEYHEAFPKRKVVFLGNLGKDVKYSEPEDGTVYVLSHEALENITYDAQTLGQIEDFLTNQVNKDGSGKRETEVAALNIQENFTSKAVTGATSIEKLGIDLVTFDEAHLFKNLFAITSKDYSSMGGSTSDRATRAYILSTYIMLKNNMQNVFMLSGTPFNNQPIEIYNALSFIAQGKMEDMGISNLYEFASNFAETDFQWVVTKSMQIKKTQVTVGFKNATALRQLLYQYILPKFADDLDIKRPKKSRVKPILPHSTISKKVFEQLEADMMAAEKLKFPEKLGAIGKALMAYRSAVVSPYLTRYAQSNNYKEVVKNSPKLLYIMQQIKNVYKSNPKAGQIIYLPIGHEIIPHLKNYLIHVMNFKPEQVGVITAQVPVPVQNRVEDDFRSGKVKVLIGSATIREGRNLQDYGAIIYHTLIEWNPTGVLQIEGRIYRQNNNFAEVYSVFPLLADSADSFYLQKMEEKSKRFNDLWEGKEDYVDVSDIDPEVAKVALVTKPENKAAMAIAIEMEDMRESYTTVNEILTRLEESPLSSYMYDMEALVPAIVVESKILNKAADSIVYLRDDIDAAGEKYFTAEKKLEQKIKKLNGDIVILEDDLDNPVKPAEGLDEKAKLKLQKENEVKILKLHELKATVKTLELKTKYKLGNSGINYYDELAEEAKVIFKIAEEMKAFEEETKKQLEERKAKLKAEAERIKDREQELVAKYTKELAETPKVEPVSIKSPELDKEMLAKAKPSAKKPRLVEEPAPGVRTGEEGYIKVDRLNPRNWDTLRQFIEDDWIRVKRLIQQQGANVTETNNPYEAEIRYWGRVGARMEIADDLITSIDQDIVSTAKRSNISDKLLNKEIDLFLIARHAPERNAQHGEKAAGISNEEATQILTELAAKPYAQEIVRIADKIQALNNQTLDILLEGQVITRELYTNLRSMYHNHIPLNRVMSDEDDIVVVLTSRGLNVKGTGLKRAKGSELEVADVLTNVVANYKAAIVRAEKNIVDLHTLRFARENDYFDGLFEEIKARAIGRTFKDQIILEQIKDPKVLPLMEKGKQVYLKINDAQLAMALRGVNRQKVDGLMRGVKAFTRFYSGLMTRFNPEFVLSNKIRDLQEVAVYLASKEEIGFKGTAKAIIHDPESLRDVADAVRGKDTEGARLYKQMKLDGGTTGGMGLSTRVQLEINLERIRAINRNNPRKAAEIILHSIDMWNTIFEDSSRLSVYRRALKQGVSRNKSAVLAKEASVNFNKMGTGSPIINALYMFSNASVQGSVKMIRAMRNPKVLMAVLALLGGAVFIINEYNDKKDKDWRKKVSKWDRLNGLNIVVSTDKGIKYVTIPISWGLKPIKVFFDAIGDLSSGFNKSVPDVVSQLVAASIEAYNPAGGTDAISAITPSILDIPVDIARNKKWSGGKIRPDWNSSAPSSIQYFDDLRKEAAGQGFIRVTRELGERGIEISPADVNYAFNQLIGGTGRFITKTLNTIVGSAQGKPQVKEIPFVSRFYRDIPEEQIREFGKDYNDLKKTLQAQDKDKFYLGQEAELAWDGIKQLPIENRRENYLNIKRTNPRLAEKIKQIGESEKLNLDFTDRLIKKLGIENGERSKFLVDKLNKISNIGERKSFYLEMKKKEIITDEIDRQIRIRMMRK